MESSSPDKGLFQLLVELTGIGAENVESELGALISRLNLDRDQLTTQDVRRVMALYLEEFHCDMTIRLHTQRQLKTIQKANRMLAEVNGTQLMPEMHVPAIMMMQRAEA